MAELIRVALAGNPNSGKTTLFNALTGSHQHVGNWPGVTVEKRSGACLYSHHGHHHHGGRHHDQSDAEHETYEIFRMEIVDLPGTYSLSGSSLDEKVARDYIIEDSPEIVVNVVEAANLERSLALTLELLEMGAHVIVALNMMDEVRANAMDIDHIKLGQKLGVVVVPMVASRNEGLDVLKREIATWAASPEEEHRHTHIPYPEVVEIELERLTTFMAKVQDLPAKYARRWLATRLLEDDPWVKGLFSGKEQAGDNVLTAANSSRQHLMRTHGFSDPELVFADARYGFIHSLLLDSVAGQFHDRYQLSDYVDRVLVSPFFGPVIFIALMFLTFNITFLLGHYPVMWLSALVSELGNLAQTMLVGAPHWLNSLIVEGIIAGVGGVLVFLPNIFLLFFTIAILEDSGYMARAAYILDQVLGKFGLAGKSFIPLVVGAGCNLAGILSCRTLDDRKDRIVTALVNPFISCSARLPIYALFTAAFFPNNSGLVLFFIYFLGITIALGSAKLFRTVFFQGKTTPLVIELPPYRIPTWRNLLVHAGERAAVFLRKMGGIILIGAVVIWALGYFPAGSPPEGRLITGIGQAISPLMAPLGIDWKGSVALLSGFVAKENVVSTYSVIYGLEGGAAGNMGAKLAADGMTALRALSFMVFTLLYMPCLATLAALKRETGSWRWVLFSVGYGLAVAWLASWLVYHIGML